MEGIVRLLRAEDRVLGGFGDAELHDALGRDLDGGAGGGVASLAGFAVHENQFAEAGEGLHQGALMYLGLVLFFITFVVLTLSKLLLAQLKKNEGAKT